MADLPYSPKEDNGFILHGVKINPFSWEELRQASTKPTKEEDQKLKLKHSKTVLGPNSKSPPQRSKERTARLSDIMDNTGDSGERSSH